MSTRTTYTSSMVIPATIRWKCSKCGSINTASCSVGVAKQVTKTGLSTGNAAEENKKALEAEWMEKMLEIMTDPGNNASQFRSGVYKKNCKCAHCSKKEFWARDQTYCHKCGKKLKPDSDFCSYCGADLRQ